MGRYDFDQIIDRCGTQCKKIEVLKHDYQHDDLLPMWIADMDFAVCPDITQALVSRLHDHPIYGYTCLYDGYWQAIIDWQRNRNAFEFAREEVTFVPGGVTAFGAVVNFFTRPGDKIVIQPPVYFDFNEVIVGNGRVPVCNNLVPSPDGFFTMNLDELERIFEQQHPKLMVVCNPQNPIGIAWSADVLRRVAQLARKHGVLLFSDEVFGDIMLYGHHHTPLATVSDDAQAVTITCGAPSKTFNIAGFKSTWLVVKNPDLRQPFFKWIEVNELCNANIVALLATEAAYRHGAQWLEECIRYVEGNVDLVVDYCRTHIPGVEAIRPQASYLVWLDFSGLGLEHDRLVRLVTDEAHLALNNGIIYGEPGRQHMRMNVGCPRSVVERAMHQLQAAISK
ncbi:MAG: pyridoxal phosphate-dependent aminotransferase [Muribaculaceae bacterium]|nr:pyridoxal phosphate-dependent aminotransferase [Muribaculaceae bacterium]